VYFAYEKLFAMADVSVLMLAVSCAYVPLLASRNHLGCGIKRRQLYPAAFD